MEDTQALWRWVGTIIVLIIVALVAYALIAGGRQAPATGTAASTTPAEEAAAGTPARGGTAAATGGTPVPGRPPVVKTIGFASVSSTTAVVVGTVVPESAETTYWFEYGPTLDFGLAVDARSAGAGTKEIGAAGYLTGLTPGTEYYFRIGAQNAYGRVYGGPYKFVTAAK